MPFSAIIDNIRKKREETEAAAQQAAASAAASGGGGVPAARPTLVGAVQSALPAYDAVSGFLPAGAVEPPTPVPPPEPVQTPVPEPVQTPQPRYETTQLTDRAFSGISPSGKPLYTTMLRAQPVQEEQPQAEAAAETGYAPNERAFQRQQEKEHLKQQRDALREQAAELERKRDASRAAQRVMYGYRDAENPGLQEAPTEYDEQIRELNARIGNFDAEIRRRQEKVNGAKILGENVYKGLESAGQAGWQAADWLLGERSAPWWLLNEAATLATGRESPLTGKNPITKVKERNDAILAAQQEEINRQSYGNDTAQAVGRHAQSIAQSAPFIVLNLMSGGAAGAAEAGTAGLEYLSTINSAPAAQAFSAMAGHGMKALAANPQAQYSFLSTFGNSYDEARQDGASEAEATVYAVLNGAFGALVEVGGGDEALGGMEALPAQVREAMLNGDRDLVKDYVKSIVGEIGEEELQGMLERGLKSVYQETPIFSTEDENAIFNPGVMLQTAKDTAIDTAIMSGTQMAGQRAIQGAQERAADRKRARIEQAMAALDLGENAGENLAQGEENAQGGTITPPGTDASVKLENEALNRQEKSGLDRVVEILTGTPTNRQAEEILQSPDLLQAFKEVTGIDLTGTKSQQRAQIKEAAAQFEAAQFEAGQESAGQESAGQENGAAALEAVRQEESTAVNTNPNEHTPTEQAVIDGYQASVDEDLVDFVNEVQGGRKKGRYWLKTVSDRAAQEIKTLTGIDVSGNRTAIEARIVEHILIRHGEHGKADQSMRDVNDIGRIQYVLDNYDTVTEGGTSSAYVTQDGSGKNRPAKTVIFEKKVNGTYYAVEAVPDSKKNTLYIVSAYMRENGGNPSPSVHAEALRETSETAATSDSYPHVEGDPSDANVPQAESSVNPQQSEQVQEGREGPNGETAEEGTEETASPVEARGPERERGFAKNVRTTQDTDEKLAESLGTDKESYRQLANKDVLARAQEIFDRGPEEARSQLERAIADAKNGKKLPPEMVPLSRMVANALSKGGDTETARRIVADVAAELTQAGELGQVGKLLRNTDPATAENSIRKCLDKVNEEIAERYGKNYKWRAELTEAELKQIRGTDFTEEGAYEAVYEQIAKRLGAEMPSTLWEKLTELRRVNMLLRPRTQIKNVLSNVPMVALRKGAEKLSGAIQDAMVKSGRMDAAEQTRTARVSKETRQLAKDYTQTHKAEILESGNKADMDTLLNKHRTYFKTVKAAEAARRLTYDLLERGDAPFVLSAYQDSLAQICEARGVTSAEGVTQEMRDFAYANAMEATYKAANVIAQGINNIKRHGGLGGKALDVVIPFTTTPANITSLLVKYSPAGFVDVACNALRGGDTVARIDAASKATVGSAFVLLGLGLRALGAAKIGKEDEDEKPVDKVLRYVGVTGAADKNTNKAAFDKANGISAYSFGGRWSYDWAEPFGSMLALGAEIYDSFQHNQGWGDAAFNALYTAGDAVLNMSIFQNVTELLKGYGSNTEAITQSLMQGGATQLIPGLAGDLAKIIDGEYRSTYTGGNALDDTAAKVIASIPGLSRTLPANVDWKGMDMSRGNLMVRTIDALLNPGLTNHNKTDATAKAIYKVFEETGDYSVFPNTAPKKIEAGGLDRSMTGEERAQYQRTQGKTYRGAVDQLVRSASWRSMSAAERAQALTDARDFAKDEAKREIVEGSGGEYTSDWDKQRKLRSAGLNVSEYMHDKREARGGSGGLSQEKIYRWLTGSGYTEKQKAAIWSAESGSSKSWDEYLSETGEAEKAYMEAKGRGDEKFDAVNALVASAMRERRSTRTGLWRRSSSPG